MRHSSWGHALGFGAVWTAMYPDEEKVRSVRKILNIPQNIIPLNVIPIGVPTGKGAVIDKLREENIHREWWYVACFGSWSAPIRY